MRMHPRPLPAMVIAVLVAFLASASVALADTVAPAATTLTFGGASQTAVQGRLALTATLETVDGKPLSNEAVDFYEAVQFLGARDAFLGTATTDSTGTATLGFEASSVGARTIRVSYPGDESFAAAKASGQITIARAGSSFTPEPLPFAVVGEFLPYLLSLAVVAVWAVLGVVLVRTASGVRAVAYPGSRSSRQPVPGALVAEGTALRTRGQRDLAGEEWR